MAKKNQQTDDAGLTAEEMAEIEELTGNLGPEIEGAEGLAEDLATTMSENDALEVEVVEQDSFAEELEAAKEEARNNQELYLRALAEMDNLRKRNQREKEDIAKFSNENILREILPVIDNLERAVEHAATQEGGEGLLEGVQMTLSQFGGVLQKFGVEALLSVGEPFDPAHHQAVGQIETAEVPPNHNTQELQKGYLLNSRLLRPSMVLVAKAPQIDKNDEETPTPTADSGE